MPSRYTDGSKFVFLRKESIIMVRNGSGDREGKFVAKMGLSDPEGFSLEFF
jgi:hypothetical protein